MAEREATERSAAPEVSVVVVGYNGEDHLRECLDSLLRCGQTPAFEVLVVDNASSDGTAGIVSEFSERSALFRLLRSERNLGYAGAVNFALRESSGAYVAVLNQDMVVEPDWLAPVLEVFRQRADAGGVNPLVLLHGSDARINSAGQDIHVTGLGFNRWLGEPSSRAGSEPLPVSGLHGAAVVFPRRVLEETEGWDASGFLYHEDVEISWLLRLLGYELLCVPGSVVHHKYHLSMFPEKLFLLERNRLAMLCSNLTAFWLALLSPFLLATEGLMWGYCLLRGGSFLRAKARSYRWLIHARRGIAARRAWIRSVRRRTDWQVLRCLRWAYLWSQFVVLGRERGESRRRPAGGIEADLWERP